MPPRALCAALAALLATLPAYANTPAPPAAELHPLLFPALHGWDKDDQSQAFAAFRKSCRALSAKTLPKPGLPEGAALNAACGAALTLPEKPDRKTARGFFEAWFDPALVAPASDALFTAYYEPEFSGALTRTGKFTTPLLAWPGDPLPDPFPDRAAIEAGAFAGRGLELVWLDPVDAFFVHIQGSARVKLPDGAVLRVNFAGKNGHPFTPIGRVLIDRGVITKENVDTTSIRGWLTANPDEATALMRENKSYIFFRRDEGRDASEGPIGAQRLALTAGRSIAVDDEIWPYGLPVWVEVRLPSKKGEVEMQRLMIAQDTGSAIRGPARGDLYIGTGAEAGKFAGRIRHRGHFIVLIPRAEARK